MYWMGEMAKRLRKRLLESIEVDDNGCWNWTRNMNRKGYGKIRVKGVSTYTHRLSYELFVGKIADGLFVCHRCDNPSCINPSHLFLGTASDNVRDSVSKGRAVTPIVRLAGEQNPASKLTSEQVGQIRIRLANGDAQKEIASDYGIAQSTVSDIKTGKAWV